MSEIPQACGVEPFRYQATPQPIGDQGASSNQINEQSIEDYLNRFREAICSDLTDLFDAPPPSGVDEFLELLDTPDSYVDQEGKMVVVNSAEDALEFFPGTFTGQAGKMVVVAGGENGFALQAQPTPPSTYYLTPRLIAMWNPNPAAQVFGPLPAVIGSGQVQIPVNPANALDANYRQQFTTAATLNAGAGIRAIVFQAIVGTATPMGGFRLRWRFGLELYVAGHRGFVGFGGLVGFVNLAVDPSTLTNILALAFDDTDTNWQIMQNDAAGVATKTDLGAGFAMNTTSLLELTLEVSPSGGGVDYLLRDLSLGTQTSGTVAGNLPAGGQPLSQQMLNNAAATGTACRISHVFMSLEVGPGE